jgi:hypothetical protein
MQDVIDEIVGEWSRRTPSGIIDINNESHINTLIGIMNEYIGNQEIIREWVENIVNN